MLCFHAFSAQTIRNTHKHSETAERVSLETEENRGKPEDVSGSSRRRRETQQRQQTERKNKRTHHLDPNQSRVARFDPRQRPDRASAPPWGSSSVIQSSPPERWKLRSGQLSFDQNQDQWELMELSSSSVTLVCTRTTAPLHPLSLLTVITIQLLQMCALQQWFTNGGSCTPWGHSRDWVRFLVVFFNSIVIYYLKFTLKILWKFYMYTNFFSIYFVVHKYYILTSHFLRLFLRFQSDVLITQTLVTDCFVADQLCTSQWVLPHLHSLPKL